MTPAHMTRSAWAEFYRNRFNKTGDNHAAVMALWYQLLNLAFGD